MKSKNISKNKYVLSEADLDTVLIECKCGNQFDLPRDCLMFGFKNMFCGKCKKEDQFKIKNENSIK